MSELTLEKVKYGNWVSSKLVFSPAALSLVFGALSLLLFPLFIVAAIFFLCFLYFGYARYLFSSRGKNIQTRVQELVLNNVPGWNGEGKVLDIGCGNGPLTIQIAKRYPLARVIGIDYWGKAWGYSKSVCSRNAEIEGVGDRVSFIRANALSLPFGDETFNLVVSNLVFHEVRGARDKKELIKEALRVAKKRGWFVFQDLFLWKLVYGETHDLLEAIRTWGIEKVELVITGNSDFIPKLLRLPFMLGTAGILYGRK